MTSTLAPRSIILRMLSPLCLLSLAWVQPVAAKPETYSLDPVHTRIAFQVSHAGFSNPIGTFSGSTGTLSFDEDDWSSTRLDVRIPIDSLNLGDAEWQKKVLDSTFFNVKKFPEAHFVSTLVEKTGEHSARLTGDLTLHGRTHPVTLEVTLNALKRHPMSFKKTAGFSATATLSRKDFGISAWEKVVGDSVQLIIEAEASRSHDKADTPPPAQEPQDAPPQ